MERLGHGSLQTTSIYLGILTHVIAARGFLGPTLGGSIPHP